MSASVVSPLLRSSNGVCVCSQTPSEQQLHACNASHTATRCPLHTPPEEAFGEIHPNNEKPPPNMLLNLSIFTSAAV